MIRNSYINGHRVLAMILGLAVASFALGATGAMAQGQADRPEAAQAPDRPTVIPNSFIVQVADDEDPQGVARAVAATTGGEIVHVYSHAIKGFSIDVPPGIVIASIVSAHAGVLSVSPNLAVYASAITNLPAGEVIVTGVDRIDADENSFVDINGNGGEVNVDIAIIDSGIDLQHPDLNVYEHVNCIGHDCAGTQNDQKGHVGDHPGTAGDDDLWHGTHVAGIAAALDNGVDLPDLSAGDVHVVGVAPGARLWAIKALRSDGFGAVDDVMAAVDYVNQHASEIEVVNISFGGIGFLQPFRDAIASTVNLGVVFVVAAGNQGRDVYGPDEQLDNAPVIESIRCLLRGKGCLSDSFPASYPEVMTVSAMGDSDGQDGGSGGRTIDGADDTFASFSNFSSNVDGSNPVSSPGLAIDVAAPGVDITSTVPLELFVDFDYGVSDGTSMATPHVAGAVALYIAENYPAGNRDYDLSGSVDADDVYFVRQTLINAGVMNSYSGDPDGNVEPIINAAGDGGPVPDPDNDPPVVKIAIADQFTDEDDPFSLSVSGNFEDLDGPLALTYSVSGPAWLSIDSTSGVLSGTPLNDDVGAPEITVTASDGLAGVSATFTLEVFNTNDPPTVANQSFSVNDDAINGDPVGQVVASDPDVGDPVGYSIEGTAFAIDATGLIMVNDSGQLASGSPFNLTVTVTDSNGAFDTAIVTITVNAAGTFGVALAGSSTSQGSTWTAIVTVTAEDGGGAPVDGATVTGVWSGTAGDNIECVTAAGQCQMFASGIRKRTGSVTFVFSGVTPPLGSTWDGIGPDDLTVSKP